MIGGYPCAFGCATKFESFGAARDHARDCPTRKARFAALGSDLAYRVQQGKLTLDEAEAQQSARPRIAL